jgi:3-hydroxyacyl-[acyl-carrier-protein] dehydratase
MDAANSGQGKVVMESREIMRWLAHRSPFLLVDRVIDFEANTRIVALKNVSFNEPFFPGHFPGNPVMPGVLILEAMAQAACILVARTLELNPADFVTYFAGIDVARFKRPVLPGDQLRLEVSLARAIRGIYKFQGKALVDGEVAAEATLLSAFRKL